MNRKTTVEELRGYCDNPGVCAACLETQEEVHDHFCNQCRNVSPRRLPVVSLDNGKRYFFDKRLRQLRNTDNPHDFVEL